MLTVNNPTLSVPPAVTFITVPANNLSISFVLFISRRYQLLTLYSVEYDYWTTKWTLFVRPEVLSAVFYLFKVSCFLNSID